LVVFVALARRTRAQDSAEADRLDGWKQRARNEELPVTLPFLKDTRVFTPREKQ
jgi:hypothetical protein